MRTIYTIGEYHTNNLIISALDDVGLPEMSELGLSIDGLGEINCAVAQCGAQRDKVESALLKLLTVNRILKKEYELFEHIKPDILYLEGSTKTHPLFVVGEECGTDVVYLDRGFRPYKDYQKGKVTDEQAQIGREEHWVKKICKHGRITAGKKELMIVGGCHLHTRYDDLYIEKLPWMREHVGKLPELLKERGVGLEIVYDTVEIAINPTGC